MITSFEEMDSRSTSVNSSVHNARSEAASRPAPVAAFAEAATSRRSNGRFLKSAVPVLDNGSRHVEVVWPIRQVYAQGALRADRDGR
jgi:hypothetical protein